MADRGYSTLTTKLGLGVLAFNSGLAIYRSWGDAGSGAFVLAADAALVLLFLCLRAFELEFEQGGARRGINMRGQYYALARVGFAVLTCNTALDAHNARRGVGSAAFVLVSYALFVILTGIFVRGFARAHALY